MIKKFVFTFYLVYLFNALAFGQLNNSSEAIRDSYFVLMGHASENLSSVKNKSLVPSDTSLISGFLIEHGIDPNVFFNDLTNLVNAIKDHATLNNIDLSSTNAYQSIFDNLVVDVAIGGPGIPGPTFCYDRFVENMQIVAADSVIGFTGGVQTAALIYIVGWVAASIDFDRCIEDNY